MRHISTVQEPGSGKAAAPVLGRILRKAGTLFMAAAIALPSLTAPLAAQGRKIPVVRDAETEELLRDYAAPIFKAAGLPKGQVEIILVNENTFNAFVPDARRMFINVGVLIEAETPGEVIGVIAHEAGHIAGRHLVRLRTALANAQIMTVVGMVLGAGAMAAGVSSNSSGAAGGGAAIAMGAPGIGQRSLLAYQRGEEAAADKAALRYLEMTGQSAKACCAPSSALPTSSCSRRNTPILMPRATRWRVSVTTRLRSRPARASTSTSPRRPPFRRAMIWCGPS
ncbi:M48 family metalloprotease [Pannonibacter sp. Pt2-lr]